LRVAASSDRVNRVGMSTAVSTEPTPFEVTELPETARVRVQLRGELDLATADVVADRLRRLRERRAVVLLDLDELAFIDAAGLRVVVAAAQDAAKDGWVFTVTRGSAPVRRLFELLDIDRLLPFDAAS
jgi:anti-anti-sigma factor